MEEKNINEEENSQVIDETPVAEVPVEETSVESSTIEAPADENTTTEEVVVENTPTEEASTETPVEETPAETPVEETPAETPVEETPTETPVEETPIETPVEETPTAPTPEAEVDSKAIMDQVASEVTPGSVEEPKEEKTAPETSAPAKPKTGKIGLIILIVAIVALIGVCLWRFVFSKPDEEVVDNTNEETEELVPITIPEVPVEEEERKISDLNSKMGSLNFVESNAGDIADNVRLTIVDGRVRVKITNESNPDATVEADIDNLGNIVAVEAGKANDHEGTVYMYALDSEKNIYRVVFESNVTEMQPMSLERLLVTNVSSFTAHSANLDSNESTPFVVVKTTDNEYFTDYRFADDYYSLLRKIVNE